MTAPASASRVFDWLQDAKADRERAGLRRRRVPRAADEPGLDLAGNDYLGLARHPVVTRAAADAALRWGAGSTGSRLVTGSTVAHQRLEEELAAFCGAEAALVFSSGYAANLAAVTALTGEGTLIVADRYNHASLIDGCRLSRARRAIVGHADPAGYADALAEDAQRRIAVTDSVFSVDGDLAPLPELAAACRRYGAALLVDDSHGLGVVGAGGAGAVAAAGLAGAPDVVATASLGKALGTQGGVVLGPRPVVEHLVETARTFIFDTGLAPPCVAAATAALRLVRAEPDRPDRARAAARTLYDGLTAAGLAPYRPAAAVVSVPAASPDAAVAWAGRCRDAGLRVACFRPPSVPDGRSRLRIAARADLTDAELLTAIRILTTTAR